MTGPLGPDTSYRLTIAGPVKSIHLKLLRKLIEAQLDLFEKSLREKETQGELKLEEDDGDAPHS
jgi:hypothetical protein